METIKVSIYVLIDPVTLKVRYIGRTKNSLKLRLSQHVFKARHGNDNTHKNNWIRSLLKINSKPIIKLLTIVDGWENSHEVERDLINKHCTKHDLVNNDDKGIGGINKEMTQEYKDQISKTLTEGYRSGKISHPRNKAINCYDYKGDFIKTFVSIKDAGTELNLSKKQISKCLTGFYTGINGYQFSYQTETKQINDISSYQENKLGAIITNIDERKQKRSAKLSEGYASGRLIHHNNKSIECYGRDNNLLNVYLSIKSASDDLNISYRRIKRGIDNNKQVDNYWFKVK